MKNILIVGAGPGVSFGVAKRFAGEGFRVLLVARNEEKLNASVQVLKGLGFEAQAQPADVSDFNALTNAIDRLQADCGFIDVLLYNAAALRKTPPSGLDPETMVEDFRVNVAGALVAVQKVLPSMQEQKKGTILLTGGGLSLNPYYEYASLSVGKAGIRNLTFSLAQELQPHGIKVGTVTIAGFVKKDTHFDPDKIAEAFWKIHASKQGVEIVYQ